MSPSRSLPHPHLSKIRINTKSWICLNKTADEQFSHLPRHRHWGLPAWTARLTNMWPFGKTRCCYKLQEMVLLWVQTVNNSNSNNNKIDYWYKLVRTKFMMIYLNENTKNPNTAILSLKLVFQSSSNPSDHLERPGVPMRSRELTVRVGEGILGCWPGIGTLGLETRLKLWQETMLKILLTWLELRILANTLATHFKKC